jgi:hypothetical protein
MPSLLVVQPDARQADALRTALRARIPEDVVVASSLSEALWSIDRRVPDVILVPTLAPASVEDYLVTYVGAIPGAGHVQILGLPQLERSERPLQERTRGLLPWRRGASGPACGPDCNPAVFAEDVVRYLAGARALKKEMERHGMDAATGGAERRREPRFATDEVPWITLVRFGNEQAALINVSSRGALLRTNARPEHQLLRRADRNAGERPRLTLELESVREVHATGRVVRCVPLKTNAQTQYEIAFRFDTSVGLHLPVTEALVPVSA